MKNGVEVRGNIAINRTSSGCYQLYQSGKPGEPMLLLGGELWDYLSNARKRADDLNSTIEANRAWENLNGRKR